MQCLARWTAPGLPKALSATRARVGSDRILGHDVTSDTHLTYEVRLGNNNGQRRSSLYLAFHRSRPCPVRA